MLLLMLYLGLVPERSVIAQIPGLCPRMAYLCVEMLGRADNWHLVQIAVLAITKLMLLV